MKYFTEDIKEKHKLEDEKGLVCIGTHNIYENGSPTGRFKWEFDILSREEQMEIENKERKVLAREKKEKEVLAKVREARLIKEKEKAKLAKEKRDELDRLEKEKLEKEKQKEKNR